MKSLVFFFFIVVLFPKVSCQEFHLGVKTGVYDYYYRGDGIVGNWFIEAYTPVVIGKSLQLYLRNNPRFIFIESGISFNYNLGSLYLTNLTPENDYGGERIFSTKGGINQRDLGISFMAGPQVKYKNFLFRGCLGLNSSYLIKPRNMYVSPWDEINRSLYRSYEPLILYWDYSLGIEYWRISLEIKRENNLTPIIKSVDFEGKTYDYRLDTKRLFILVGFNFYPWKKKDGTQ